MLAILLLFPLLILLNIRGGISSQKQGNPPSPWGLPIIGNLHQIGSLPHRSLAKLAEKHGPLMLLRFGQVPTLVVSSAEAAREIVRTHDIIFSSRPSMTVTKILAYGPKDLAFSPHGDYWRWARKIFVTQLLSNKMVQSFQRMREEEVAIMLDKVSSMAGGTVDMTEVLSSYSNDIICRAVSGKFSMEGGRNRMFRMILEENNFLLGAFHVKDFIPSLGWLDGVFFGLTARAKALHKRWDHLLDEVIRLQADRRKTDHGIQDGDFVEVLLSLQNDPGLEFALDKDNIKALIFNMFGAGMETTYTHMEWALAELVRNPEVMKKLQDEVREVAKGKTMVSEKDLSELSYLKAVLMETLRLCPPGPLLLSRESTEDCEIYGYRVPKKTRLIINYWAIARDPKNWDAPDEFRPERFIGNSIDFRGKNCQFIPFGAGRRICPGINFSIATSEIALANLIYRFDWDLAGGMANQDMDMDESPGLAMHMKERLKLVPKPYAC